MICFPNAKINIGLRVTEKRPDGYHTIETIFYPVAGLYDCLEFEEAPELRIENIGIQIDTPPEKNLCFKAWHSFKKYYDIPPIEIHLLKNIPFGGGLGGGSADAAFLIKAMNEHFAIGASNDELEKIALEIGSDCPFFIQNKPVFAEGRGEIFTHVPLSLKDHVLIIAKPNTTVSTKEAYAGITPRKRTKKLIDDLPDSVKNWRTIIENDFEDTVFKNHPEIAELKQKFYDMGAIYAAMSGSGSTVYGIFEKMPVIPENFPVICKTIGTI